MYGTLSEDTLRRFHDSFDRCARTDGFLDDFYDRLLLVSDEVRRLFEQADMAHIKSMLRQSLWITVIATEGTDASLARLRELAGVHHAVGVRPRHFDTWRRTLLALVAERDSRFDDAVAEAWDDVLGVGLHQLVGAYPPSDD